MSHRPLPGSTDSASPTPRPLIRDDPGRILTDTSDDRIAAAPLPTRRTLRRRSPIPLQLWRFGQINLRMLRMVCKLTDRMQARWSSD